MKQDRASSLVRRLASLLALQTALGLGAVCVFIYVVMTVAFAGREREELTSKVELLRHILAESMPSPATPGLRHKLDDVLIGHNELQISIFTAGGEPIYRSASAGEFVRFREATLRLRWSGDQEEQAARVVIVMDTSSNAVLLRGLAITLVLATVFGAAVASVGGLRLVKTTLRPLTRLELETRALAPDRLEERLREEGYDDELLPWIRQFNQLLARLEAAYRQLEGFNADVAHELRTPLATLITRTEVDLRRDRSIADYRESIYANLEDLQRLASIVNDMLFLSRADRGAKALRQEPESVADAVQSVVDHHETAMEDAHLRVCVVGDAVVEFDKGLLRRAVSNLLDNATRHAQAGTEVEVRIEDLGPSSASVAVSNHGDPISKADLPKLFDRFFRVERSRKRCGSVENHGLGLAIVAAIARMHDGHTFASSSEGRTTVGFFLHLPPAVPPDDLRGAGNALIG